MDGMVKKEYDLSKNLPVRMIICIVCEKKKVYHARNMCTVCYADIRNKKRAEVNNLFI